jgi:hypothetical protein
MARFGAIDVDKYPIDRKFYLDIIQDKEPANHTYPIQEWWITFVCVHYSIGKSKRHKRFFRRITICI